MPEILVYVNQPSGEEHPPGVPSLEEVADTVAALEPISGVRSDRAGSVLRVSFAGGRAEQEEIERAIEASGYEIQRLSISGDYPEA